MTAVETVVYFTSVICGIFRVNSRSSSPLYIYKRDLGLGDTLARPLILCLEKLNWPLDVITSVPLGLVRFKERGYNQATLLARPNALYMNSPFSTKLLSRIKETRTQVGLTVIERQQNMDGAFTARHELVHGKNVLVIDDVATSGAIFNGCAKALIDQGASRVYGISLARAMYHPNADIDIS